MRLSSYVKSPILFAMLVCFVCSCTTLEKVPKAPPDKKIDTESEAVKVPSDRKTFTNSVGMKFVYVPHGTFMMGSTPDEPYRFEDERLHKVTLTKGFYIQTTEVTQGQWKQVMGNNPSFFKGCEDNCPVEMVSWEDVQNFIRRLQNSEGINEYRLPTEAEWEYACRAGSSTAFANGNITEPERGFDPKLDEMGWYSKNSEHRTHPVAQRRPNNWGLYDMHGNVWEWCQDWFGQYPPGSMIDQKGTYSGSARVIRGGSWCHDMASSRSAKRNWRPTVSKERYLGFRLILIPLKAKRVLKI